MLQFTPGQAGLPEILKRAFRYWSRTLFYQVSYSLLYFSLFFLGYMYLFRHFGLWEALEPYRDLVMTDLPAFNTKAAEIAALPQAQGFVFGVFILLAIISPLNVGFYEMYRKVDAGEKPQLGDLFTGFRGIMFFRFLAFYLFWTIMLSYANIIPLLSLVWLMVTVLSVPLMLFHQAGTFQGIKASFQLLKLQPLAVAGSVVLGILISLSGVFLFGVGLVFTFPFWHAVVYALYSGSITEKSTNTAV